MTPNHLIIGLGGTGGKIIRSLRKTIFREFRKERPDGVNVSYLYVDSSAEMMALDDQSWKILGTSVQLDRRSQLLIQEANLSARLDNIDNFPGIKPWIGNPDQWRDILGSIIGVTLGGQKRRLGRFLFSAKVTEFQDQIRAMVKDLQAAGTTEITFHVCCGLAGGTGSGSVIDVLAQLRSIYPDSKRYRTILYTLLPETYPNPSWDTGNYHANGYAALLELNALSVGAYRPFDVSGRQPGRFANLSDPFNGCYAFTNENDNGLTVNVDSEMPDIVADFLYQKIVAVRNVSWPTLGRMENAENGDGTPERAPGSNTPERTKRLLAFGIKRLAVPEEEIGEYLTYQFARQAALQLRYNTWSDSSGYSEEAKNQDFHEFVRQPDLLYRWTITDEHLTLSTGILPEDAANKRWKTIGNEWQDVMPNFKSVVREKARETWLDELAKLCERRFDQDYRGLGVRNFYRTKLKSRKEHIREIRRHIEGDLFTDWKNGVRSVADTSRLLAALIEAITERLSGFDALATKVRDNEADAAQRVKSNGEAWAHMSLLQKMAGKPDSLFTEQGQALLEQYVCRTRMEALGFAKQIVEDLAIEISSLKSEVDRVSATIGEAIKRYGDRIAERVRDSSTNGDLRAQLVRFYDPQLVRDVARNLVKDENEQRTQTTAVRLALLQRLGDHPDFAVFNQRIGVNEFMDAIDKESAANSQTAHNNLVTDPKQRLLGVSIVSKLKERYGGNSQDLRTFVSDLVTRAGNYLALDPSEVQKVGPGIPSGVQTAVSRMTVIIPKAPEEAEFVARLRSAFENARGGETEFIDSDKPNEIVLVSLTNLFPERYIRQAAFLRQKYEAKIAGPNAERAKLELHTEGDGSQWPRIFVPAQDEVQRGAVPNLLLAKALGLVRPNMNPATGKPELIFVAKDASGFDTDPIVLGATLATALTKLEVTAAEQIRTYVQKALDQPENTPDAARDALRQAIVADVESVKVEKGGNVTDEVYRRFLDGGRAAVGILKREN